MTDRERKRLYTAGGISVGLNLLVWLAVSQGFAQAPAPLPPATISRVSVNGDGQVVPEVVDPSKTGRDTKEIAGVPMSLPAAEELKRLANAPQVPPLRQEEPNRRSTEQTRREVERTIRDFGYNTTPTTSSNSSNSDWFEPEVNIRSNPSNSSSTSRPPSPPPQKPASVSGAKPSQAPNSPPVPTVFGEPFIPDGLKGRNYKKSVKVRFEIDEEGRAQPTMETSTGVPEVDNIVRASLSLWQWRPAFKDGKPYASTWRGEYIFEGKR